MKAPGSPSIPGKPWGRDFLLLWRRTEFRLHPCGCAASCSLVSQTFSTETQTKKKMWNRSSSTNLCVSGGCNQAYCSHAASEESFTYSCWVTRRSRRSGGSRGAGNGQTCQIRNINTFCTKLMMWLISGTRTCKPSQLTGCTWAISQGCCRWPWRARWARRTNWSWSAIAWDTWWTWHPRVARWTNHWLSFWPLKRVRKKLTAVSGHQDDAGCLHENSPQVQVSQGCRVAPSTRPPPYLPCLL